jgi:Transposase DDE domain
MNNNNPQQKKILRVMKNGQSDYFYNLLSHPSLVQTIKNELPEHRRRLYPPLKTLSMFLSQAISNDSSCQKQVSAAAFSMLVSKRSCSVATGGYCKARRRLPESMIEELVKKVASLNKYKTNKDWLWRGRNIYLVDGTTITMPDTKENQEVYPQPIVQAKGLGFPICRIVGIISLATGSLVNAAVSPFQGKGASEQVLLRSLLSSFKRGDIILADAFYSTYSLLSYAISHGIDIVFVQNGVRTRKTDFTTGTLLGNDDHLITIKKPKQKPSWIEQSEYDKKPNEISIREVKAGGKILITTMLCEKTTTAKTIKNLYKRRWQIELDFRNIKTTLGLKSFSCKTPQMVIKEMWIYFLAYNFIRSIMLESALCNNIPPRQLSFKHTLQLLSNQILLLGKIAYQNLLTLIGKKRIGNREGRIEPRAIKKRQNGYPLLMTQRGLAREEIGKNGHPGKLK